MQRLYFFCLVALSLLISSATWGQINSQAKKMSHEEEVVRTTYGKLSFAARTAILWNAVTIEDGALSDDLAITKTMDNQIRFDLTDFTIGNVANAKKIPWTFMTEGPEDAIDARCGELSYGLTTQTKHGSYPISHYIPSWKPSSLRTVTLNTEAAALHGLPLVPTGKDVIKTTGDGKWSRYASYSVVATLNGRAISYRATFLFSGSPGKGEEILPLDYAVQGIFSCINRALYPSALVDTGYREIPFVHGWIVANEIHGCKKLSVPESCCDPVTGRCGIASEDLQHSMETALDEGDREMAVARLNSHRKEEKR